MSAGLKREFLRLLKEDEEFRYAVAGLIGLEEILKRLTELREDMNRGFEGHGKELERVWAEIKRLREDMARGFERHDKEFGRVWEEIKKLREDMNKGFKRHDREFERVWGEIKKLREDMKEGFERLDRRLVALGSRWGLMAEEAFREGMKRLLQERFGVARVERWEFYDAKGEVRGFPSLVELDLVVRDETHHLIEVKSSVSEGDIWLFNRKCEFYARTTGVEPEKVKKLVLACFADEGAKRLAEKLGIELITA